MVDGHHHSLVHRLSPPVSAATRRAHTVTPRPGPSQRPSVTGARDQGPWPVADDLRGPPGDLRPCDLQWRRASLGAETRPCDDLATSGEVPCPPPLAPAPRRRPHQNHYPPRISRRRGPWA